MIYLLCFSDAEGNPARFGHAGHYLGYTADANFESRMATHRSGSGSRLVRAAQLAGLTFEVVRTWPGGRTEERRLKNLRYACKLCPRCRLPRLERDRANDRKRYAAKKDQVSC